MELVRIVKQLVSGPPPLDPAKLRKAKPLRNPIVEAKELEGGSIELEAPLDVVGKKMTSALAKRMGAPETKRFELEEVGAFVWKHCDGQHTFETISRKLREKYKMTRLESDAALSSFLQMLSQRRLITLMVAKDK